MSTFVPQPLLLLIATVAAALFAIAPTGIYLYVEPRSRMRWGRPGVRQDARRAPGIVRLSVWLGLACAQLAVVCLVAAVACGLLVYVQLRLGAHWPMGLIGSAVLSMTAIAQGVCALQLAPLSLRLLLRDTRARPGTRSAAARQLVVACLLGGGEALCGRTSIPWAVLLPKVLHPWLRVAVLWSALRPVEVVALACGVATALLIVSDRFVAYDDANDDAIHKSGRAP